MPKGMLISFGIKAKPKSEAEDSMGHEQEEESEDDAVSTAAKEFAELVKDPSASAEDIAEALKSTVELCMSDYGQKE